MDAAQIISTVLGTGGILTGIVAWYRVKSTKQVGLSGVEVEDKAVNTADWSAWQEHWPAQIDRLEKRVEKLEADREEERAAIEAERKRWRAEREFLLEELEIRDRWIWEGRPPPPPERRPFPSLSRESPT